MFTLPTPEAECSNIYHQYGKSPTRIILFTFTCNLGRWKLQLVMSRDRMLTAGVVTEHWAIGTAPGVCSNTLISINQIYLQFWHAFASATLLATCQEVVPEHDMVEFWIYYLWASDCYLIYWYHQVTAIIFASIKHIGALLKYFRVAKSTCI